MLELWGIGKSKEIFKGPLLQECILVDSKGGASDFNHAKTYVSMIKQVSLCSYSYSPTLDELQLQKTKLQFFA